MTCVFRSSTGRPGGIAMLQVPGQRPAQMVLTGDQQLAVGFQNSATNPDLGFKRLARIR
jgi:hypothetical protein